MTLMAAVKRPTEVQAEVNGPLHPSVSRPRLKIDTGKPKPSGPEDTRFF